MKTPHDDSDGMFADLEPVKVGKKIIPPPVKVPGSVDAATRYARELFLFGNGDGKRIIGVTRIAELSGVSVRTVQRWLPVWERESRAMARSDAKPGFSVELTKEKLLLQSDTVTVLECEIVKLKKIIPSLTVGGDLHSNACKLLMSMLKQWEESSGFAAYASVGITLAKETAKQQAKLAGRGTADEPNDNFSFGASRLNDATPKLDR